MPRVCAAPGVRLSAARVCESLPPVGHVGVARGLHEQRVAWPAKQDRTSMAWPARCGAPLRALAEMSEPAQSEMGRAFRPHHQADSGGQHDLHDSLHVSPGKQNRGCCPIRGNRRGPTGRLEAASAATSTGRVARTRLACAPNVKCALRPCTDPYPATFSSPFSPSPHYVQRAPQRASPIPTGHSAW